jgi:hypothetical protein
MKTITKTIKVYSFSELPEDIQEKIIATWRSNEEYFSDSDNTNTLYKFCDIFGLKVINYEYGYRNFINFALESHNSEDIENFSPFRLRTYIINNFYNILFPKKYYKHIAGKPVFYNLIRSDFPNLTGYYLDSDICQPIYEFLKKPYQITFYDLMYDCLQSWVYACNKDFEYWFSLEAIKEDITNNDYLFTETGEIYYENL